MKRFLVYLYTTPTPNEATEPSTSFDSKDDATDYAVNETFHTPFYGHVKDSETGDLVWIAPSKPKIYRRAAEI